MAPARSAPARAVRAALLMLALLAACVTPREEPGGRGWAPPVLPAHATLRPVGEASGEGMALLVETERGVLLRVLAAELAPGSYELVLGHDDARGWQPEPLGSFEADEQGRGGIELELEGQTLAGGSRLLGRTVALIGPGGVLRGEIDKGVEVEEAPPPPAATQPPGRRRPL